VIGGNALRRARPDAVIKPKEAKRGFFKVCILDVDKWRRLGQSGGVKVNAAYAVAGRAKATRPPILAPAPDGGRG
jgi:hypothetical protein